jgi:hypothetical protein
MSSVTISLIAFAIVFGGAMVGMAIRSILPPGHFDSDCKDVVKLGMGLVATLAALVLGLLTASAKSSLDTQNTELTEMSSKMVLLDRVLAHYGPDAQQSRIQLRRAIVSTLNLAAPTDQTHASRLEPPADREGLYDSVEKLPSTDDEQRFAKSQALSILMSLGQTRWLIMEQRVNAVPVPLLIVLVFWLSIIFTSFGLFAPRNITVVASLLVSALSVSGAIFLILEMYSPYTGIIHVSTAPLREALTHLGQ